MALARVSTSNGARLRQQTDKICDAAMPFNLVPHKLARLSAGFGVRDTERGAEDGPVEGENSCALDELGMLSQMSGLMSCRGPHLHAQGSGPGRVETCALPSHMCERIATEPQGRASIRCRKEIGGIKGKITEQLPHDPLGWLSRTGRKRCD